MKKMLFSLLSSAFLALTAQEYHLFRFAKAPVIDGKITERSWNAMPEGRGFYKIFRGIRYARNRLTTFRMGYDNENLYICAFCQEPTPEKMKVLYSYRDGFVCDDSIELFLLPKGKKKLSPDRHECQRSSCGALGGRTQRCSSFRSNPL